MIYQCRWYDDRLCWYQSHGWETVEAAHVVEAAAKYIAAHPRAYEMQYGVAVREAGNRLSPRSVVSLRAESE